MGGCSAVNCTNSTKKGFRLFKFPADNDRRKKWITNCRRDDWVPSTYATLCIDHFEESQFEEGRADGWKKLKPTAIPTIFNVPNPPPTLGDKRVKGIGCPKPNTILASHLDELEKENDDCNALHRKIALLEREVKQLKDAAAMKDEALATFLSEEQLKNLTKPRSSIVQWSNESIIKALKLSPSLKNITKFTF